MISTAVKYGLMALFTLALMAGFTVAAEMLLRVTNPANSLPQNGIVNGQRYTWGHLVENNAHGFRERDFVTPEPPGVFRIMVLGDSLTWGAGLSIDERYTGRLQALFSSNANGNHVEVLNFGLSGGPTTKERDVLLEYANLVDPDLIVIGFCLNDPQVREQNYSIERETLNQEYGIDWMTRRLSNLGLEQIARHLRKAIYKSAELLGVIPHWTAAIDRTYEPESSEWRAFTQALSDIRAVAAERGLPPPVFVILNQGFQEGWPADDAGPHKFADMYLKWYHQAEAAAAELGFQTANVEREVAEEFIGRDMCVNAMDCHPNSALNAVYANKIFETIKPMITIDGVPTP